MSESKEVQQAKGINIEVQQTIVDTYEETHNIELCYQKMMQYDIKFSKVIPTVKRILKDAGLLVPLKDRKEKFLEDIEEFDLFWGSYHDYDYIMGKYSEEYMVPKSWVIEEINLMCKENNISIPLKLKDWQAEVVAYLTTHTDNPNLHECVDYLVLQCNFKARKNCMDTIRPNWNMYLELMKISEHI